MDENKINNDTIQLKVKEALEKQASTFNEKLEKVKNEYEQKITHLEFTPKVKDAFIKNGGNEKAFNAFYTLNKDKIKADKLEDNIKELSKEQEYFFGKEIKISDNINVNVNQQLQEKKIKTLNKDNADKFIGKTLYKK